MGTKPAPFLGRGPGARGLVGKGRVVHSPFFSETGFSAPLNMGWRFAEELGSAAAAEVVCE